MANFGLKQTQLKPGTLDRLVLTERRSLRQALVAFGLAAVALVGCRTTSVGTTVVSSVNSKPDIPRPPLLQALHQLRDTDLERREDALSAIREYAQGQLASEDVRAVISAASADLPKARFDFNSYDASLLQVIWPHVRPEHVSDLLSQFPRLSEKGQAAVYTALAHVGTAEATRAYVQLLRDTGWPSAAYPAMTLPFEREPRFASLLLPAFVDGSIRGMPDDVAWGLLLAYAEAGKLPTSEARTAQPHVVRAAGALVGELAPLQERSGIAWRWGETYLDLKYRGGLALDLLGHLGRTQEATSVLRTGEQLADPRPRMFAALSLLRLGESPSPSALKAVAADPETRNILFDRLVSLGKTHLFPKSEMTQAKLAESEMVNWLIFPTELGRAPDEIELMQTIERDLGDHGVFVYYIFRFKTHAPHWSAEDGWTAGVAGPFRRDDFPTTTSWGDTFSTFTKWNDFAPEEHLASIEELMKRWREHHAGN